MIGRHVFDAQIREGRGGGTWVEIPFDVAEVFGSKGQVRVNATVDGRPCRGSLAPMGGGMHGLGIRKEVREAIGKSIGDTVHVVIERDTEPRAVTLPDDLRAELAANPEAERAFAQFAYTYQKEYARWIESAKRAETRERRLRKAIEKIARGEKL